MLKISLDSLDKLQSLSHKISAIAYMRQLVNADIDDALINLYDPQFVRQFTLYMLREQEFELTKQLYKLVTDDNFATPII